MKVILGSPSAAFAMQTISICSCRSKRTRQTPGFRSPHASGVGFQAKRTMASSAPASNIVRYGSERTRAWTGRNTSLRSQKISISPEGLNGMASASSSGTGIRAHRNSSSSLQDIVSSSFGFVGAIGGEGGGAGRRFGVLAGPFTQSIQEVVNERFDPSGMADPSPCPPVRPHHPGEQPSSSVDFSRPGPPNPSDDHGTFLRSSSIVRASWMIWPSGCVAHSNSRSSRSGSSESRLFISRSSACRTHVADIAKFRAVLSPFSDIVSSSFGFVGATEGTGGAAGRHAMRGGRPVAAPALEAA